jgi:cytochrome c
VQTSKRVLISAIIAAPIIWCLNLPAAHADRISDGRAIAQRWCSSCHDIGAGDTRTAKDVAPTFESVSRRPKLSREHLETWIGNPHPPMPNLHLTREEIENLVDYIESLKTAH